MCIRTANGQDMSVRESIVVSFKIGPYTLPLKHYSWVQQEIETFECAGVIKKSISPWASPTVVVPKKSAPGEPPRQRMCVDLRKINELQPEMQRVDK